MRLPGIPSVVSRRVGRQILVTQKNSPVILFGIGVVGVVTTVVLASKATLKLNDILDESEQNTEMFNDSVGKKLKDGETYTEVDAREDGVKNKGKTVLKIVKLYLPATVAGVATVSAFTGSHVILSRRYAAASAAYAAVDLGFREYRKRVVDEFGDLKDREFRAGVMSKELAVDTDDGVAVKTVKTIPGRSGYSIYARCFDETNRNWKPNANYNMALVANVQSYMNDLLKVRGHVFLNEVYDALGMDRSAEGQLVGWVKNSKQGDSFIDFGIVGSFEGMRFVNGDERSVWIDPNVDGIVYDLI